MRFSRFRRLEELPGPQHPAVYRIEFACGCGDEHLGLVSHDELDWAPLGLEQDTTFVNLMTSKHDSLADELTELAAQKIRAGEWPWSFFCWPEDRPRPAFPSAFRLLAESELARPRGRRRALPGLRPRVGEPRHARARRRAVPQRPRDRGGGASLRVRTRARRSAPSSAELYSSSFDVRRLDLR